MSRGKKILVAIYLALSFLLLRLIYALVFNGLEGDGVILSLPELQLPRPFSHITLFGDISAAGVLRNLELGAGFALGILSVGLAAALISQRQILQLAIKAPRFRNLLNALALSLSVIPALFDAAKKVSLALQLRNERRNQILVPIFERAVEIANALGLRIALEVKPNQGLAGISIKGLRIKDLPTHSIDLEVSAGEIVVLSGATGSGKSSILEAAAGVLGEYRGRQFEGSVEVGGELVSSGLAKISSFVGFVPQNPRELAIGLDACDLKAKSDPDYLLALKLGGVSGSTAVLSEGEIYKLVLAGVISRKPSVLLLDEPFDALDGESRKALSELLNNYAAEGNSILLTEHEPQQLESLRARRVFLDAKGIHSGHYQPRRPAQSRKLAIVGREPILTADLPAISRGRKLIDASSISLRQAECVWLSGENGAGKSTYLAELLRLSSTTTRMVLVPENFDDFFLTASLGEELARADRIAKVPLGFTLKTLKSILPIEDLENWFDKHPRDLSRGTRLALAIAMQLSHKPQVLLLDEPFRGFDPLAKDQISQTLSCVQETGCAILFASQEPSWSAKLANRQVRIENHKLVSVSEVRA